jgi:lipopolysaccharide transport system ATP-binding protein
VTKQFTFGRPATLKSTVTIYSGAARCAAWDRFEALHDIDLMVMQGQSVGIIGENGSANTLLKLIANLPAHAGTVHVEGQPPSSSWGRFHPSSRAGRTPSSAGCCQAVAPELLERPTTSSPRTSRIIDQPTRTYSSGMFMRLGFSGSPADPDVLLIDEALRVGAGVLRSAASALAPRRGKTIVLVSTT